MSAGGSSLAYGSGLTRASSSKPAHIESISSAGGAEVLLAADFECVRTLAARVEQQPGARDTRARATSVRVAAASHDVRRRSVRILHGARATAAALAAAAAAAAAALAATPAEPRRRAQSHVAPRKAEWHGA